MKKIFFLTALLVALHVSCSTSGVESVSKKDLIGKWSNEFGLMDYILYEDGTGKVGALSATGYYDMKWELTDDSLFIKEVSKGAPFGGAFRIDSLKAVDRQGGKTEILYLSYTDKEHLLSPYSYKGYGYNFNDGPNESFLSDVANGFLTSENGYCWLLTENGMYWLTTDDGKQWLASEEGQAYINYIEATTIRQTEWTKE